MCGRAREGTRSNERKQIDMEEHPPTSPCPYTVHMSTLLLTNHTHSHTHSEFFGLATYKHPSPPTRSQLASHFPNLLSPHYAAVCAPAADGETIPTLYNRLAYTLAAVISALDADPSRPRAIVICTHAACMIAMGRILTGRVPDDPATDDFQCYTASLSVFRRRKGVGGDVGGGIGVGSGSGSVVRWSADRPRDIPSVVYRGVGVMGGWDCLENSGCGHLSGGAERGW